MTFNLCDRGRNGRFLRVLTLDYRGFHIHLPEGILVKLEARYLASSGVYRSLRFRQQDCFCFYAFFLTRLVPHLDSGSNRLQLC